MRETSKDTVNYSLFDDKKYDPGTDASSDEDVEDRAGDVLLENISSDVVRGSCTVVMGHPEAFLSQTMIVRKPRSWSMAGKRGRLERQRKRQRPQLHVWP